jgi:hypothetical protein
MGGGIAYFLASGVKWKEVLTVMVLVVLVLYFPLLAGHLCFLSLSFLFSLLFSFLFFFLLWLSGGTEFGGTATGVLFYSFFLLYFLKGLVFPCQALA